MTATEIRKAIWTAKWGAYATAPSAADYTYWEGKWPELEARGIELGMPDYPQRRLLGWQATGADMASYGPYASPPSALHAVPAFPGDAQVTVPPAADPIAAALVDLRAQIATLTNVVTQLATRPAPLYVGESSNVPLFGTVRIVLRPDPPS